MGSLFISVAVDAATPHLRGEPVEGYKAWRRPRCSNGRV